MAIEHTQTCVRPYEGLGDHMYLGKPPPLLGQGAW